MTAAKRMSSAVCHFCELEKPLIKAHIIPRSFFSVVRADAKYSVAVKDGRPEFTQAGIYDSTILCETCEAQFTHCDTYGFEVLEKRLTEYLEVPGPGGTQALKITDLNYPLFRRFLLSVLWRASVASHRFFSKVSLGKVHEPRIRSVLRASDLTKPDQSYPSMLFLPIGSPFRPLIITPAPVRFEHVSFYRINFPNVVAMIKVDQRDTPYPFNQIELGHSKDNLMVFHPYAGSPEHKSFENWRQNYFGRRG